MTATVRDVLRTPFDGDAYPRSVRATDGELWERIGDPALPFWEHPEHDPSDRRKQDIESGLAWGEDL